MNITFLIGNGFDVGMGLRSKFSHYFQQYIDESKDKKESLKELSKRIEENKDEWSYFERKLGEYTEEFTIETQEVFKAQLRDFELGFIKYLKKEENTLVYDQQKIRETFGKAFLSYYKNENLTAGSEEAVTHQYSRFNQDHKVYNFVNFNYTDILEKCLSVFPDKIITKRRVNGMDYVDKLGEIVHIHGHKDKLPLMGVNDVTQIKNKELANDKKFVKFIVKPLLNKANRTNYDKKAMNLISNSHIICIYGMALGETDKDWWKLILRWLNSDSNRQLVVFDYDKDYNESTQFDFLDKEDSIIERFGLYGEEEKINVESLRTRIHIAVHKNIFELNLRKEESEIEQEVAVTE
jgi:hypothetical protein